MAFWHAVGDLADQQVPAAALLALDLDRGAQPESCRARSHRPRQSFSRLSTSTPPVGKSGPVTNSISARSSAFGIVDQVDRGVDQLGDIVRRDRGRHADRDPARAIGEQIGEQAGEDLGLFLLAIVGRPEVDRALVEPGHQLHRDRGQPRLGVAVGGGVIAVDIAEIALAVDQRIAKREILGEADHRVVDRLVAVRMIFADHVADDAGRFLVGAGRIEPQQPHRPQQAAVDRLQPVADIGQRPRGDRRQRIDEVALGQRGVERGFDYGRNSRIGHGRLPSKRLRRPATASGSLFRGCAAVLRPAAVHVRLRRAPSR